MPASFQEILNSRSFKFIVGEEVDGSPSEFFVHEDAIAQLSKPLHALTKGGLSEARAGCATWKDVSKETFERFVQFAYTGDYSIPKTEKRSTIAKLEKIETSTSAHPSSPKVPNGIRRQSNSHELDDASPVEPRDRSEPVPEKLDEDPEATLNHSSPLGKKGKKKKKSKGAVKAPLPELEPEQTPPPVEEPQPTEPQPKESETEAEPESVKPAEPEPVEKQRAEELRPVEPERAETTEPEPTPFDKREKYPDHPSNTLAVDFQSLSYQLLAPRDNYGGTCEPATDFHKEHSYSNVLLSHASLYVLGDFQLIDSLKALALFKLHKTLCIFQLDDENVGDITDLARYAYSEEGKGFDEGVGGLRGLVCQYMAIHAVELAHDTRFMNLLAEGGQIVKDFFKFQLQRMH